MIVGLGAFPGAAVIHRRVLYPAADEKGVLWAYTGALYAPTPEGDSWDVLDSVKLGWRMPPFSSPAWTSEEGFVETMVEEEWPGLTRPASGAEGPLLAALWRYRAQRTESLEPVGPWELADYVVNWPIEGEALLLEQAIPPPPVGRPRGTAPPEGDHEVPYVGAGTGGGGSEEGASPVLIGAAVVAGLLLVYAVSR